MIVRHFTGGATIQNVPKKHSNDLQGRRKKPATIQKDLRE
jgi:hypothetical protein